MMSGFDDAILEVLNLKGLSVMESPRLFISCLADVSGTQWQRENALMKRNCDRRFFACFSEERVFDSKSAAFARSSAIALLKDECGLAETFAVDLSDSMLHAICTYRSITLQEGKIETIELADMHEMPDTINKDKDDPYANVGRNEPCPRGSGKTFKECHGQSTSESEAKATMIEGLLDGIEQDLRLSLNHIIASEEQKRKDERAAKRQAAVEKYRLSVATMVERILANAENRDSSIPNREIIEFGNYPMGVLNNKKPIEWIVLDRSDMGVLLISKCVIDVCKVSPEGQKNWETSDIRRWNNEEFLRKAFSEEERKHILYAIHDEYLTMQTARTMFGYECLTEEERKAVFADQARYRPDGDGFKYARACPESYYNLGKVVSDRVLIMSAFEARCYFVNEDDLKAPVSGRLKRRLFSGNYWLRSSTLGDHYVAETGAMLSGCPLDGFGIRPMIWVDSI